MKSIILNLMFDCDSPKVAKASTLKLRGLLSPAIKRSVLPFYVMLKCIQSQCHWLNDTSQ